MLADLENSVVVIGLEKVSFYFSPKERQCQRMFNGVYARLFSHVWIFVTPWTVASQAPLSVGFSRQEYWTGLPFSTPGDLPDSGIKPTSLASPAWQADALQLAQTRKPEKAQRSNYHTIALISLASMVMLKNVYIALTIQTLLAKWYLCF